MKTFIRTVALSPSPNYKQYKFRSIELFFDADEPDVFKITFGDVDRENPNGWYGVISHDDLPVDQYLLDPSQLILISCVTENKQTLDELYKIVYGFRDLVMTCRQLLVR